MVTTRTFAAFDFDGTLTRRDTVVPFLTTVVGRVAVARALASESVGLARVAAGRGDRDVMKERFLGRVLARPSVLRCADARAATFGTELARSGITKEARDRIAWHRREGHEVVIVSASLDVYLDEVARRLGVVHVLCTTLEHDENDLCTGRLLGANCRGAEKATRLRALIDTDAARDAGEAGAADNVGLWAYGNSHGDDEMLAMAQHPVRARRGQLRPPAVTGSIRS